MDRIAILAITVGWLAGCAGKSLPQREYDPKSIASAAMNAYDTSQDGQLDDEELVASPSLLSAVDRIDTNGDQQLEVSELQNRISAYAAMSDYIVAEVSVSRGRRPVAGATVTMTLSGFMGSEVNIFSATTDTSGVGIPVSSPESLLGFPPGFYDAKVEKGGETWDFGVEIADDNPSVSRVSFDLNKQ